MNIKHWYGTLAKYDAVATKDSGTLYHCSEGLIYKGSVLLSTRRWGDLSGVPSTFAPSAHTHTYTELTKPAYNIGSIPEVAKPLFDVTRADRMAFLPADQIIIEQSTDGGVTWVDAGVSENTKNNLFVGSRPTVSIPLKGGEQNTDCMIRITITGMKYDVPDGTPETSKYDYWNPSNVLSTERYCTLEDGWAFVSSLANRIWFDVQIATGNYPNSWSSIRNGWMSGWSGGNYFSFSQYNFGGGTNQPQNPWNWRFVFRTGTTSYDFDNSKLSATYNTSSQSIYHLKLTGKNVWGIPNRMMYNDHLYSWDYGQNAIFPSNIYAQAFRENGTYLSDKYASKAQTMYIGTTAVNINRTSGALALTGITSINPIQISGGMTNGLNPFTDPHLALKSSNQIDNTGYVGMTFWTSAAGNYGFSLGALRTSGGQGNLIIRSHINSASGTDIFKLDMSGSLSGLTSVSATSGAFSTKITTGGYNYTAQTAGVGIGADGTNSGVMFYNGTGASARIYRDGDVLYFNRGGDTSKGFELSAAGVLTHGGDFSVLGNVTGLFKLTGGLQSTGGKVSLHNTTYSFAGQSEESLEVHSNRITSKSSDIGLPGLIVDTYTAEAQTYGADMLFDVQKTTGGAFTDMSKAAFVFSTNWSTHLLKISRGGDVTAGGSIGTSTADGANVRVGLTRILYDSSIGGVHFLKDAGGYSPLRAGAITANGEMQATGFYQTSLRSAKMDIKFFDQSALEVIRDVDVVSYRYKSQTSDETHIGYIADDTHELLSGKKHDHANQGNAIGLLIKAVQELEKQNKELLDQVKTLQS